MNKIGLFNLCIEKIRGGCDDGLKEKIDLYLLYNRLNVEEYKVLQREIQKLQFDSRK